MKRATQADLVLQFIRQTGSITSLQAIQELGIIQLPRRIYDLKARGVRFSCRMVNVKNRRGETTRVKRYTLRGAA